MGHARKKARASKQASKQNVANSVRRRCQTADEAGLDAVVPEIAPGV